MAYPMYNPYSMAYQPTYQQPVMQQPVYQSGINWVNDYAEMEAYPMAPNTAGAFWDRRQTCIYVKQTDATGRATVKVLDYKERGTEQAKEAPSEPLATKEDMASVLAALKRIEDGLKGGTANE